MFLAKALDNPILLTENVDSFLHFCVSQNICCEYVEALLMSIYSVYILWRNKKSTYLHTIFIKCYASYYNIGNNEDFDYLTH